MRSLSYIKFIMHCHILLFYLVLRVKGGMKLKDERAEYLVNQYADDILRIGYTWLGNLDDAKDICQITFLKLLQNDRPFEDSNQERAWVVRVAINSCKDWKKSAWFRHRAHAGELPELQTETDPRTDDLLEAINHLKPRYRQVIYMYYYEGFQVKEIAALLKCSESLVSTHLARARKQLKLMIGDEYDA